MAMSKATPLVFFGLIIIFAVVLAMLMLRRNRRKF